MLPITYITYGKGIHGKAIISVGNIVGEYFINNGFFIIQNIGYKKYLVNINNETYQEFDNIDKIYPWYTGSCRFDGKKLTLYALRNDGYYQYKIK